MSVNRPTDPKLRDQDIEKKLQLYGIVTAFGHGKVPSNKQIDVAMNSALAWKPLANPPSSLSREGQHLCADLRDVIEKAKVLLLSKNQGDLIQDFTWQTRFTGSGAAGGVNAPVDKDTAKQHANEAGQSLRTLGELLITNGQFRKLLSDASILLRDVAGDAAQKTANKVNPSEEQLNQIDDAEQDHTWHDTPNVSRDGLKQQMQQAREKVPIGQGTAKQALGDATQAAHPSGQRDPRDAAQHDQERGDTSGADPKSGMQAGLNTLKGNAEQNMSEEDKRKAEEQKERARQKKEEAKQRAREYVDKKMPKERREQVIYRLKKMVVECQEHSEYQQAIDTLLRLAEEYQGHSKNLAQQGKGNVQGARSQGTQQSAESDLKTLIERFANGSSFDDVTDAIDQIYRDADNDPELKDWFKKVDAFIRKCLKQSGFILEDSATEEYNKLYDQGQYLLRDKYKDHTDRITDELKYIGDQFDQDAQNRAFADSMEKLFKDLGQDENGQPTFKPHLLKDLQDVILPGLFKTIGYIPIPRIEYTDPMIDAVVENLIFEGDNITPNVVEFGSDNYWQWARSASQRSSKNKNKVMFSVSGIQADIKDIAYYVKKKQGFPSVSDLGVMDIFFGGSGISFKVAMETADKGKGDDAHFFKINTVTIDIQNMDIKLKQSNHKLLFNIFKPLLLKVVKPVVQKVLEKQIRDNVAKLDAMCYRAKKEGDRAAEEARRNPDPDNVQNIYQRYFTALQQQMSKGQQKTQEVASDKKANVAITQHDSILKNIQLPGGFSTRATKYNNMAREGDKWQSPIFSLGSAGESRSIPPTNITRRDGSSAENMASKGSSTTRGAGLSSTTPVVNTGTPATYTTTSAAPITGATTTDVGSDHPDYRNNFGPRPNDGHTTLGSNNPLLPGSHF